MFKALCRDITLCLNHDHEKQKLTFKLKSVLSTFVSVIEDQRGPNDFLCFVFFFLAFIWLY